MQCQHRFRSQAWECPKCGWKPSQSNGFVTFAPALATSGESFKPHYFEELANLESRYFWFTSRNYLLAWAFKRFFPKATSFFEIGCGTGFVSSYLASRFSHVQFSGSDIFLEGLAFARSRSPALNLFQMDALHMPFADEFDVVAAFDVIEHIADDDGVLRQMNQAATTGGGIMLTVPQHPNLWSAFDDYSCHQRRYTRAELVAKVARAGFRVAYVTSFVSLLLPAMYLMRRKRGATDSKYDLFADMRLPPLVNSVLQGVMCLERALIKVRLPLPVGGSLLMIGYKE